jgi:hypothetical protein
MMCLPSACIEVLMQHDAAVLTYVSSVCICMQITGAELSEREAWYTALRLALQAVLTYCMRPW